MKSFINYLKESIISNSDAKKLGDSLNVDWTKVDLKQFALGLSVESEHDDGGELDVVDSKKDLAKIVLAHLKEKPDYYTKLKKVEEDAPTNSVGTGAIAGLNEPFRQNTLIRRKKSLKENDDSRMQLIKSLMLKQGESDLTDKELNDFAKRSRIKVPQSPAMLSVHLDLNGMGKNRLKQIIAHPRVDVFAKHIARKLLSGEWKEFPVKL